MLRASTTRAVLRCRLSASAITPRARPFAPDTVIAPFTSPLTEFSQYKVGRDVFKRYRVIYYCGSIHRSGRGCQCTSSQQGSHHYHHQLLLHHYHILFLFSLSFSLSVCVRQQNSRSSCM